MAFKLSNKQRKQIKRTRKADHHARDIAAGLRGYMKTMAILSRGCDVSAA